MVLLALVGCDPVLENAAPGLAAVNPALICVEHDSLVTVTGSSLTPTPTQVLDQPSLQLPDLWLVQAGTGDVQPIDETDARDAVHWVSDTTMTFVVGGGRGLPVGVYAVSVANADGQSAQLDNALAAVPAPAVTSVNPDDFARHPGATLTLTGTGFLQVGAALPSVTIGTFSDFASAAGGCTAFVGPADAQSCTSLTVTVPGDALEAGDYGLMVTNPAPADCSSTDVNVTVHG